MPQSNWHEITVSAFPWEQEALTFIRERLPTHEPYQAWSNFEFVGIDGTINEVDLLVVTPLGFFLVEIKSRPGTITGDAAHWTWHRPDGRLVTDDNPLFLARRKTQRLASLLKAQKKVLDQVGCPFIEPLIFCSAPDQHLRLTGTGDSYVCLRDEVDAQGRRPKPGIMAALINRDAPGLKQDVRHIDRPQARAIAQALAAAGIRPSQRSRRIGDYQLEELLYEGPNNTYQDWRAVHASVRQDVPRRIRVYNVARAASAEERERIRKAARREYQLLERLQHEAILPAEYFTEHELGPAIVYRDPPQALRLDHFLAQRGGSLTLDTRLHLLRQLAEAVKFAHSRGVIHRALSPQCILVSGADQDQPSVHILNWYTGRVLREAGTASAGTATLHPEQLVEDASLLYLAPETITDPQACAEYGDVFSLGAIAYHLFAGRPPAASLPELLQKLGEDRGLNIAAVLDGAGPRLVELVRSATCPEVTGRYESVEEFLVYLAEAEDELTAPAEEAITNPLDARRNDQLPGGFTVKARLGKGGSAVVLLVERAGREVVLKLACRSANNARLQAEFELLKKLRHQYIVEVFELVEMAGLTGFTMQLAGHMTMSRKLREEGRLGLELLQRFGEDLLDVLRFMEREGYHHRDLKPDNLGVGPLSSHGEDHVILFDFSLANAPLDQLAAGTPPYLDPFLKQRHPPRWDLYAERFAAAMTLYEMATGTLPAWGDGRSDPAFTEGEAILQPELFEASLRERMTAFFAQCLARDYHQRFDNADQMDRAWSDLFHGVDQPATTTHDDAFDLTAAIAAASLTTPLLDLRLTTRAINAFDRINAMTVGALLQVPLRKVYRLRGVGSKTRKEIADIVARLHARFPQVAVDDRPEPDEAPPAPEFVSIDTLAREISGVGSGKKGGPQPLVHAFLGLDPAATLDYWPTQSDAARAFGVTASTAWQTLNDARERWRRLPTVTKLRQDVAAILDRMGGVMAAPDLAAALLAARGSVCKGPDRARLASAVLRVAVEAESGNQERAFDDRRKGSRILVTRRPDLADYALRLGQVADRLAARDPLAAPARAVEDLRAVAAPDDVAPLRQDHDLLRLAAYCSEHAAVSSRLELYPRGMSALRALRLAQGALSIARELTVAEIGSRVAGRYPEALPLPPRPELDALLTEVGLDLVWVPTADDNKGAYRFPHSDWVTLTTGSSLTPRSSYGPPPAFSPEEVDARLFERKLRHAERDGAFLVLSCHSERLPEALAALRERFAVDYRSLDAVIITALRQQAQALKVDWDLVLQADAADRASRDWQNLQRLIARTIPEVEQQLLAADRTLLLAWPGLLARYDQMALLDRLRDRIGTRGGLPGLWLLLPGNGQTRPTIAGRPIPILDSGQYTRIPEQWLTPGRGEESKG